MPAVLHPTGLDPDLDEARRLLQEELQSSAYVQRFDLVQWLADRFADLQAWLGALGAGGPLVGVLAVLVLAALVAGALVLIGRSSRRAHVRRSQGSADLGLEPGTSAAEYLRRAQTAFERGAHAQAVADAFRSIAVDAAERTLLEDLPSRTAHEIADRLAGVFPDHADAVGAAGGRFDAVVYGEQPADADDARRTLALTRALHTARPRLGAPA